MIFKVVLSVAVLAAAARSLPAIEKRSPQMPSPPGMPPGMPAPPMSPPGMIIAAYESQRFKRQAPETTPPAPPSRFVRSPQDTTPPSRFARHAQDTTPPSRFARHAQETTPPSRVARQAETTPPSRVARSLMYDAAEVPKTIAQEAFYSKITTINGDK